MDLRFNVQFRSTGILKPLEGLCGSYLIKAHNRMAQLTDGRYEVWNKEWEDNHNGNGIIDDSCDAEYIEFINAKATAEVIPTLEKEFNEMTFEFGSEHQLIGHVKCMENSAIEFFMVPVN